MRVVAAVFIPLLAQDSSALLLAVRLREANAQDAVVLAKDRSRSDPLRGPTQPGVVHKGHDLALAVVPPRDETATGKVAGQQARLGGEFPHPLPFDQPCTGGSLLNSLSQRGFGCAPAELPYPIISIKNSDIHTLSLYENGCLVAALKRYFF